MNIKLAKARRIVRVRSQIKGTSERPRLSVFRSNQHIYAQLIDDGKGVTLVAASSQRFGEGEGKKPKARSQKSEVKKLKKVEKAEKKMAKTEIAVKIGKLLAEAAKKIKIQQVRFDRGAYSYHGRVKAVAEGAREGGLQF